MAASLRFQKQPRLSVYVEWSTDLGIDLGTVYLSRLSEEEK